MGTGVVGLALAQWPGNVPGLRVLAEGLWLFNILLFVLFTGLYTARWVLFFDEARRIFGHSTVSMFFGTIPMGLATLINGLLVFGLPRWGERSEEHTSELQSLMRISYAVFCLKKKKNKATDTS